MVNKAAAPRLDLDLRLERIGSLHSSTLLGYGKHVWLQAWACCRPCAQPCCTTPRPLLKQSCSQTVNTKSSICGLNTLTQQEHDTNTHRAEMSSFRPGGGHQHCSHTIATAVSLLASTRRTRVAHGVIKCAPLGAAQYQSTKTTARIDTATRCNS